MLRALLIVPLAVSVSAADLKFREHTIEDSLPGGYQVRLADMNSDGRVDVLGLSMRSDTLYWYENPSWRREAIVSGMETMVNLDVADIDGDGTLEIALGSHFGQTDRTSEGRVYILRRTTGGTGWEAREVDRLPTTHRLRFFDLNSDGRPELVNSPLTGPGCEAPLFDCTTGLVYYAADEWRRRYVTTGLDGVVHGMREVDWDGPAVLTASMGGVDRFRPTGSGGWSRSRVADGKIAPRPESGASDVRLGRSSAGRFVATIEPWHGNEVVVYCCDATGYLSREVIDTTLVDGHALNVADFDGDGHDEILAGFRGQPHGVMTYRWNDSRWDRTLVDAGDMAAASCDVADLDGDGDPDFACIGSRTANIKWYENVSGTR